LVILASFFHNKSSHFWWNFKLAFKFAWML
jgi:hypothetical protein